MHIDIAGSAALLLYKSSLVLQAKQAVATAQTPMPRICSQHNQSQQSTPQPSLRPSPPLSLCSRRTQLTGRQFPSNPSERQRLPHQLLHLCQLPHLLTARQSHQKKKSRQGSGRFLTSRPSLAISLTGPQLCQMELKRCGSLKSSGTIQTIIATMPILKMDSATQATRAGVEAGVRAGGEVEDGGMMAPQGISRINHNWRMVTTATPVIQMPQHIAAAQMVS